jgi:hypothetical protein
LRKSDLTVCFAVIPVKTGIQEREKETWIPASAGMTSFFDPNS